jgi:hypothetical protein
VIIAVVLLALAARQWNEQDSGQRAGASRKSPFDGKRAYDDLIAIVEIGPRPPGSEGAERLRVLLREKLAAAGLAVSEHAFEAHTPLGSRRMVNLVAKVVGSRPGVIALSNHYDTKHFPDIRFVGANDGGSTTAWMLEMARTLGPKRTGRGVWLIWFDGEEALKEWTDRDSLYGSREMVRVLRESGQLEQIRAVINVDMIGDCYLGILRDPGAPAWLSNAVWTKASELGLGGHFLLEARSIADDHVPFRLAGAPALNLIDYEYGGSPADHRNNWHTVNDTIEKVCPASLQAVGDVLYHAVSGIEAYLDAQAKR